MLKIYKKISYLIVVIVLMLTFTYNNVYAVAKETDRNFKRITIDDGLSQGSITKIMQDSKGYMWIGTRDGLNKYNGNKFKVYNYSDSNENSISGNRITDIKEDNLGNIWVGTSTGLNKIDPVTNEITRYLPNENGCNISHYMIKTIMITKDGDVFVGTDDGLNKYDKENDNFIRVYNSDDESKGLSNQDIYSMVEDINGDYWVGTKNGLNKVEKSTGNIEQYRSEQTDKQSVSFNFINSLYADPRGYLWIGTYYGGLNKLNLRTQEFEYYFINDGSGLPGALIRDILVDSRGKLWVATDYGVATLDENSNEFTTYNFSNYNINSVVGNEILCIAEERSGAIWIGTIDGISLFNPDIQFNYYKSDPIDNNSLSSNHVTGIYEDDDGILWVGTTYDGVNVLDRKSDTITRIDSRKDYDDEVTLSNNFVREITGIDNEIWIATESGLTKFDKDTNETTIYKSELGCTDIWSLYIDKDGILWIGTRVGFYSFDRKDTFKDYSQLLTEAGVEVLQISSIDEDEDGVIWLGGSIGDGLVSLDKRTNEIKIHNKINEKKSGGRDYHRIRSINAQDGQNIWVSTDRGLIKYDKETEEYIKYTEEDGLPNNFIYGALFEDEDTLWVSTNYGISKFNIKEEKFMNFDSTDGIQGNEFNQYSYFKSKTGEMFFGGTNGLTSFKPESIKDKEFSIPVEIESVRSNYGKVNLEEDINLSYENDQLQFEFFMPDYRDTKKVKYAYMLSGLDKTWTISENVQSVNYSNLNPGKYVFKVKARNSSGEWSEETTIDIIVRNPPWKTPIAYVIYFFLVATIIYLIWNRVSLLERMVEQRTRDLNIKLKENEELYTKLLGYEKYKNNYFINLSHELRTPLNVISSAQNLIDSLNKQNKEITKEKMNYYMKTIKRNCGRLRNLIDNIVNTSKIEAGHYKLNVEEHDIVYLVEEVALSMKELIDERRLNLIVEPFIEEKVIECDAVEVERVIINLISNAIKFTDEEGKIEVYIWDLGDEVKISVKDNGMGIADKNHESIFDRFSQAYSDTSEEYGGSGLGLTLSRQLIELHGGKIWVESELGKGSEFIIILPTTHTEQK